MASVKGTSLKMDAPQTSSSGPRDALSLLFFLLHWPQQGSPHLRGILYVQFRMDSRVIISAYSGEMTGAKKFVSALWVVAMTQASQAPNQTIQLTTFPAERISWVPAGYNRLLSVAPHGMYNTDLLLYYLPLPRFLC